MIAPSVPLSRAGSMLEPAQPALRNMHILHLCPSLAGGGAERQLCYLSRELGNRGHQVEIGLLSRGPNIDFLMGCQNVRLHILGKGKPVMHGERSVKNYDPFILKRVVALIRSVRPDVIQTWISQMDIIGGIAAKATGLPWVLREPSSSLTYAAGGFKLACRAWLGRTASAVVANSKAGSDYWGSISPSMQRVIIRNGVPMAELSRVARLNDLSIPDDAPLILWAGRFDQEKNVELAFQGIADAVSNSSARAIFCGSGLLRGRLEEMLRSLPNPSRIELWPYQTQLWPLMKRADVFVSVSLFEGSPNCVMEAMACGIPVVVSDIPEHRELLSPESAEFVDPRCATSISAGIQRLLADRRLAEARAHRASLDVARFSIEEMTRRYENLYRSLLAGGG